MLCALSCLPKNQPGREGKLSQVHDPAMIALAKQNAAAIGAGHSFMVFMGDSFSPLGMTS